MGSPPGARHGKGKRFGSPAAAVALTALAACAPRTAPLTVGSDTFFYGRVVQGQAFGVRIGEPWVQARRALAAQGIPYLGGACDFIARQMVGCEPATPLAAFAVNGRLRRGTLLLELDGGRVRRIAWSLYLPAGPLA